MFLPLSVMIPFHLYDHLESVLECSSVSNAQRALMS